MLKCNGYSIGLCTFSVLLCTDITLQRDYPFVFSLTVYKTPRFPPYEHVRQIHFCQTCFILHFPDYQ